MGNNVKRIEQGAFYRCPVLRFIRLSKTLDFIGQFAFGKCHSLEALFLPSTVNSIEWGAFCQCPSLRLLILPDDINLDFFRTIIIHDTAIHKIAEAASVEDGINEDTIIIRSATNVRQVNDWLYHHMDESPFHKLCYDSSITTKHINNYLNRTNISSAFEIDAIHGMTPLHMLSMNPHAPADSISSLFGSNTVAVFCLDNQQKTPLDYARDYNVGGLVRMLAGLCNHRNGV